MTATELSGFLASDLFKEINIRNITNLYFWAWAAKNQRFLTSMMVEAPLFFTTTLQGLFTRLVVPIRDSVVVMKGNSSTVLRILETEAPVTVSYFELIVRSFQLTCDGEILSKALCENIFNQQDSILPSIIKQDYRKITAIMLVKNSTLQKVEYWGQRFIDFYACKNTFKHFSTTCDFQYHMMTTISSEFMKKLSKMLYKGKSYLFWLSQLSHKPLYMMIFSNNNTYRSNNIVIRDAWVLQDDPEIISGQGPHYHKEILQLV